MNEKESRTVYMIWPGPEYPDGFPIMSTIPMADRDEAEGMLRFFRSARLMSKEVSEEEYAQLCVEEMRANPPLSEEEKAERRMEAEEACARLRKFRAQWRDAQPPVQCPTGKVTFQSKSEAAKVQRGRDGFVLRPYLCPVCYRWHNTKRPQFKSGRPAA